MSGVLLRDFQSEDEPEVEALWRRVFGAPRGGQTLAWLFRPGPGGDPVRAVAEAEGRVVAHAGVAALRLRLGGETVKGGYSVAAMTDPALQGRGLYVRLGRYLYERLEQRGFALVAGFANARSHRLMTGALGRRPVGPLPWCVRPIRPGPAALGRFAPEAPPPSPLDDSGVSLAPCAPGDPRLDDLWRRVAPTIAVGAVRDSAFGSWRYATRPEAGYECWLAESDSGTAAGLLVLRLLPLFGLRFGFLVDLLVAPAQPRVGRALLRLAARRTRAAGGVALSALLPPAGATRTSLRRAGFVRVPEALHPQVIRFSALGFGRHAARPELGDAAAWWLSWADTDVV